MALTTACCATRRVSLALAGLLRSPPKVAPADGSQAPASKPGSVSSILTGGILSAPIPCTILSRRG